MCSLYALASVQSIEISPFLPHGAVHGLQLQAVIPHKSVGSASGSLMMYLLFPTNGNLNYLLTQF